MFSPELLKDFLITIQCLKKEMAGSDVEKIEIAQEACHELLDGFYEEYQDIMVSEQYKAAKDDPDYFLVLIQLAYYDEEFEKVDKHGGNQYLTRTGSYSHKYRRTLWQRDHASGSIRLRRKSRLRDRNHL